MPETSHHAESRLTHTLAVCLVIATFPLIWVGGMVTTYDAGMAVPDWPNTFGYNLFLYPWQTWLFGPWDLFIEHGHRLLGAGVGMLTIAVLAALVLREPRSWVRWYGLALLLGVIGQGVLGGMRVLFDARVLAKIHGCTGPLFFAMCVVLAVVTAPYWQSSERLQADPAIGKLHRRALLTTLFAYLQIVLGAQLRHFTPGLDAGAFQTFVVFHLVVALALAAHVVLLANCVRRHFSALALLQRPSRLLVQLIALQLCLGAGTWFVNYGWPAILPEYRWTAAHVVVQESLQQSLTTTAHVACGSLIFVTAVLITLRAWRLVRPEWRRQEHALLLSGVAV